MLNDAIRLGQLHEFISEIIKVIGKEKTDKIRWEFYLHRVFGLSYAEYEEVINNPESQEKELKPDDVADIVNDSADLLDLF